MFVKVIQNELNKINKEDIKDKKNININLNKKDIKIEDSKDVNKKVSFIDEIDRYVKYLYYSLIFLFILISSYQSFTKSTKRFVSLHYKIYGVNIKLFAFFVSLILLGFYFILTTNSFILFSIMREYKLTSLIIFICTSLPLNIIDNRLFKQKNKINIIEYYIWYFLSYNAGLFCFMIGWNLVKDFKNIINLLKKISYFKNKKEYQKKYMDYVSQILFFCAIVPLIAAIFNLSIVFFYYFNGINLENFFNKSYAGMLNIESILIVFESMLENINSYIVFVKNILFYFLFINFIICSFIVKKILLLFNNLPLYAKKNKIDITIFNKELINLGVNKLNSKKIVYKKEYKKNINIFTAIYNLIYKSNKFIKSCYFIVSLYFFISVFNVTLFDQVLNLYINNFKDIGNSFYTLNIFFNKKYVIKCIDYGFPLTVSKKTLVSKIIFDKNSLSEISEKISNINTFIMLIIIELLNIITTQGLCYIIKLIMKDMNVNKKNKFIYFFIKFFIIFSFCSLLLLIIQFLLFSKFNYNIYFIILFIYSLSSAFERSFKYMILDELIEKFSYIVDIETFNTFFPLIKNNAPKIGQVSSLIILYFLSFITNIYINICLFFIISVISYFFYNKSLHISLYFYKKALLKENK